MSIAQSNSSIYRLPARSLAMEHPHPPPPPTRSKQPSGLYKRLEDCLEVKKIISLQFNWYVLDIYVFIPER